MKRIFALLFVVIFSISIYSQNLLPEKWKFKTGDDPAWASPAFNDSAWRDIIPGTIWEHQGEGDYDGFAWYRVTFNIPSGLKEVAKKYGGFNLLLGKIDDVDFTFFNGQLLESTGKLPPEYETKYNADRVYSVPAGKIRWDEPNTIAVRVFDLYGGGGIYSHPIQFSVRGLSDYITIEPVFAVPDRILKGDNGISLTANIINHSKKPVSALVVLRVVSDFGKEAAVYEKALELEGKGKFAVNYVIPGIQPGFYSVNVTVTGPQVFKTQVFNFGYEPEKISSPPDAQMDFESFWMKARKELAAVEPAYKLSKIDTLCTPKRNVYLVEMRSLGNVLIRGWYSVPVAPGKYPAIMQVPGYSGFMRPEHVDYGDGMIGFGLNIRGHGNSQDDINPGFPGFLLYGIEDKETYIYRGAYMDCVRGIDFLFSRPEVDTTRVAVEGGSQGGALTFATTALDNTRIKACAPLVPFLSDFEHYFQLAVWPDNEFTDYVEKEQSMTWHEIFNTLSYFDIKNLAGRIRAPMIMGVGLVDDVCPPHINFAAYNQVTSEKRYIVYPQAGHGLPEDFYTLRMEFLREKLK